MTALTFATTPSATNSPPIQAVPISCATDAACSWPLSARSQTPMRAITKPKVISAMLVLTQASNVRSLACSSRESTMRGI